MALWPTTKAATDPKRDEGKVFPRLKKRKASPFFCPYKGRVVC